MDPTVAKAPRSAKDVIDAALRDNSAWERLCYGMVILLIVTGLTGFATGIILGRDVIAVGGVGVTGLFWPALAFARRMRAENIRIRLHEIPLSMADSPDDALRIVAEATRPHGRNPGGKSP